MAGCFQEYSWKIAYGPGDDRLRDFYIPALSRSVWYERTAGFFSSWSLAMAAAGVAHLVQSGGRMRLLVGAALDPEDVEAIERGEESFGQALEQRLLAVLEELASGPSDAKRKRLEVLAWLVAAGRLEIRVVLPLGPDGRPLPADLARDYFHAKEGLFTDACGHQMAFSGSVNETPHGWRHNYEHFSVYFSWDATRPYLLQVAERIRRLWEGREENWRAIPVPEAVRQRLIRMAPSEPSRFDPLEREQPERIPQDQRERIVFAFLRDVPFLEGSESLGVQTAVVRPWPHQVRVIHALVQNFPGRFLLADEVGLGKTIEVGLALRTLLLRGWVRRCLILVPRSVLRQWQEELYEKCALDVVVYDGHGFRDYFGPVASPAGNPWNAYPVLLTSSQLAKHRKNAPEVLEAGPWDLVVVDEAHHVRRKDIQVRNRYRPNRLLALLDGESGRPGLKDRTRALWLLTATPMQLHPIELYDLLRLLDLPPAWAASEEVFLSFFEALGRARREDDVWGVLLGLTRQAAGDGDLDALMPGMSDRMGPVAWERVKGVFAGIRPWSEVSRMSAEEKATLLELTRRASPVGQKIFRTTRQVLRKYREMGWLQESISERKPEPVWIKMTQQEWDLYCAVEDYVSEHYQRLEGERKGLGFIMTVYRRRLTSSLAALRRSLERRKAFLLGRTGVLLGLTDEDLEEAELSEDLLEEILEEIQSQREHRLWNIMQGELREIDRLLEMLSTIQKDTKFIQLVDDLRRVLAERDQVAVFTQYTDTMDDLRERLIPVYGRQLACYSGRGGERWDGQQWTRVSKEEIQEAFRAGEIRVLLCTDAASEGLNLQTCGVLINYDMPWNPMRVEQRIGRFDRIGQRHPDVWIHHYFLMGPQGEETVEARVYRALAQRIRWFQSIVGGLAPILARASRIIESTAMQPREKRAEMLEKLLQELQQDIEVQTALPNLDEWADATPPPKVPDPPVALQDLEKVLRQNPDLRERFRPHPEWQGVFRLDWSGRLWDVTFDPDIARIYPERVRLLTWGEPLLEEILRSMGEPVKAYAGTGVLRVCGGNVRQWFRYGSRGLEPIQRLRDLDEAFRNPGQPIPEEVVRDAQRRLQDAIRQELEGRHRFEVERENCASEAIRHQGWMVLARATVWIRGRHGMGTDEALRVLGNRGYPWAPLIRLIGYPQEETIAIAWDMYSDKEPKEDEWKLLEQKAQEILHRIASKQLSLSQALREQIPEASAFVYLLPDS